MEIYSTEEQQVEALKDWWKANGTSIIVGTVIGLAGLFGWRYYSESRLAAQEAASQAYQQAVSAEAGLEDNPLHAVIDRHGDSAYALLAAMDLAQQAVDAGQLDEARSQLEFVLAQSDNQLLAPIASLRLARVLAEQQQYEAALARLAEIQNDPFRALVEETKGDIHLRQGQLELARSAYQAAADAGGLVGNAVLQMKLDDLADRGGALNG